MVRLLELAKGGINNSRASRMLLITYRHKGSEVSEPGITRIRQEECATTDISKPTRIVFLKGIGSACTGLGLNKCRVSKGTPNFYARLIQLTGFKPVVDQPVPRCKLKLPYQNSIPLKSYDPMSHDKPPQEGGAKVVQRSPTHTPPTPIMALITHRAHMKSKCGSD